MGLYNIKMKDGSELQLNDEQINQLSTEEANNVSGMSPISEQPTQTYKEQAPGLLARVKETGYSGLSDNDKRLYDAQYIHSQAGRSGMSLEEARKMADEFAAKNNPQATKEKGTYQKVREFIVPEVAQTLSPLEYWKDRVFKEGKQAAGPRPYAQYVEDNIEAGNKGEGIVGMIGDPATTAQIIASGLTGGGSILAEAVIGGLGNIASYYGNIDSTNIKDALIAGGIGSLLGGASAGLVGSPSRRVGKRDVEVDVLNKKSNKVDEMIKSEESSANQSLKELTESETDNITNLSNLEEEYKVAKDNLVNWKPDFRESVMSSKDLGAIKHLLEAKNSMMEQLERIEKITAAKEKAIRLGEVRPSLEAKREAAALKAEKVELEKELKELKNSPYYPLLDKYMDRKVGGILFNNPLVGAVGDVAKSMGSAGYKLVEPAIDRVGKIAPVKVVTDKIKSKSPVEWVASTRPEEVGALISNLAGKYAAEKTLKTKKKISKAVDKVEKLEERKERMWGKKK